MKRYIFRLSIALLTVLIGIAITSIFMLFAQTPKIEVDYDADKVFVRKGELHQITGEIEIRYAWSLIGVDSLEGRFKVTNKTNNTIYYEGFSQNDHIYNWIKQNGEVKSAMEFGWRCLNGLELTELQKLKPNESVVFSIPFPQYNEPFKAGFDFKIGDDLKEQTIWVDVKKQLKSTGIHCKNKIVKSNSILAETCISDSSK